MDANKKTWLALVTGLAILAGSPVSMAKHRAPYILQGNCASLPAERTTEFHGNPARARLLLGMAGNQWTVFDQVMRDFNAYRGRDGLAPAHQASYTLAQLNDRSRSDYYIQLIPPGTLRDQIKSGCMVLANIDESEPTRNFLPLSIEVRFDVFSSTTYSLMRDLAKNGFTTEALPYIKNKLDLLVPQGNPNYIGVAMTNPSGLGTSGDADYDKIFDTVMDLLNPEVPVSQVDHINEGIHSSINDLYRAMDKYVRTGDPDGSFTAALNSALDAVAMPQPGSPAATRTGISTNFNLAGNAACNYGNGTLRFCEFAVLNKANTHETRVHHVETPQRVRDGRVFTGPLWITEVVYAQLSGNPVAVEGVNIAGADPNETVNVPQTFSITRLATSPRYHRRLADAFIDWIRSPAGQQVYMDGGFIPLTDAELAGGECYAKGPDGNLIVSPRVNNRCD